MKTFLVIMGIWFLVSIPVSLFVGKMLRVMGEDYPEVPKV